MVAVPSTMLALGTAAPDFALPDTAGAIVSRTDFAGRPLLVVFLCNHCPFVKHLADDLADFGRDAASRGEQLGLNEDEVRFYDALANNESAVRELTDATLKLIAHELAENLRQNLTVDWSARESVQARLRLMVKRILRKYKYPPDQQDAAVELVLQQAKALGEAWA